MNNKALKIFFPILELFITSVIVSICILGCMKTQNSVESCARFAECALRCAIILVFSFFYYFAFPGSFGSSGFFIPVYILFTLVSELKISENLGPIINQVLIPSNILVPVFIFSNLMTASSMMGYGIFYEYQNNKSARTFLLLSFAICLVIVNSVPKPSEVALIWDIPATRITCLYAYATSMLIFLVQLFTKATGSDAIKNMAAMLLILGNCINLFYDTFIMNIVGTAFFAAGCITIMILSKLNEVRL